MMFLALILALAMGFWLGLNVGRWLTLEFEIRDRPR